MLHCRQQKERSLHSRQGVKPMKNIRPIIDEMIKTATDLNVRKIDYSKGNRILVEDYYKLKHIVKNDYEQIGWDTRDLQNNKFSKLFDSMVNDDYLTYIGLSNFIRLLANIDMCYGMANFVEVVIINTKNDDEEDTNDETDNGR